MGCANIAKRSMIPAIKALPEFNLVAVASRSYEKASAFATLFSCEAIEGYDNLIARKDIDAVYMPLPTGLHFEWINKTLDAGKHLLAEKSIAENYSSAQFMVRRAKEKKLALMENYMFQYHSQHQFVIEAIKNGEIGEIRIFKADFGFPPLPKDNFRYDDKIGGGALLDCAGYPVRAAHFIIDETLDVKAASLVKDNITGTNIYGGAFLKNNKGINAQLGFGMDNAYKCEYEIWGSKGRIVACKAFTPKPNEQPVVIIEKQGVKHQYQMNADNHFEGSLKEFFKTINNNNFEKHYYQILLQSKTLEDIRTIAEE